MPTLHDQLGDAVDDVTTDLDTLAAVARRRGTTRRRVRQGLTTAGSAAAVLAIAAGGWALLPGAGDGSDDEATAAVSSTSPAAGTIPITGRLAAAVELELIGQQTDFQVQDGSLKGQDDVALRIDDGRVTIFAVNRNGVYSEAWITTDGGTSKIGVNVQHWAELELPTDCSVYRADADCRVRKLPDGDVLRTATEPDEKAGSRYRSAELISPSRDLRIVVGSTTDGGDTPALTPAQLAAVATDPVWGFDVPAEYQQRAKDLSGFTWWHTVTPAPGAGKVRPTPGEEPSSR